VSNFKIELAENKTMKKRIIYGIKTIVLLLLFPICFTTSQEVLPLKPIKWRMVAVWNGSPNFDVWNVGNIQLNITADTIINNKNYKKATLVLSFDPTYQCSNAYLRNDTVLKKIFLLKYPDTTEYVMLNYGMNYGDSADFYTIGNSGGVPIHNIAYKSDCLNFGWTAPALVSDKYRYIKDSIFHVGPYSLKGYKYSSHHYNYWWIEKLGNINLRNTPVDALSSGVEFGSGPYFTNYNATGINIELMSPFCACIEYNDTIFFYKNSFAYVKGNCDTVSIITFIPYFYSGKKPPFVIVKNHQLLSIKNIEPGSTEVKIIDMMGNEVYSKHLNIERDEMDIELKSSCSLFLIQIFNYSKNTIWQQKIFAEGGY
jgi:hypothetical protein